MLLLGLRHIILKTLLISLELIGAILAGAVVLVSLLAWRLSEGPLKLEAVQPYLVAALSQAVAPLRVTINETGLDWTDAHTGLGFTARGIQLINTEGQSVATLPELKIGLSVPALLIGRPAPSLIRLSGLQLRALRTADGVMQFSLADEATGASTGSESTLFPALLEALSHPVSATSPLGALRKIELNAARVEVVDYQFGVRWQVPRADFQLERDRAGMRGTLRMDIAMGTETPTLEGGFLLEQSRGDIRFDLGLDKFNPAGLASWSPSFADLGRINVPLSGRLTGRWIRTAGISDLHFDLSVGEGQVKTLADQPPLAVKYAQLVGSIDRMKHRLEVQSLYADFGGNTKLSSSAVATREGNDVIVSLASGIDNMPASDLPRYWLPNWAPGAHDWVTQNITDGLVPKAQAQLRLAVPLDHPEAVRPVALDGTMRMQGLTVNYFRPLPPATDASGSAHFDLGGFHIAVDKASVGALSIDKASVDLVGLNDNSDRADIAVTVSGKLADQLLLLDHEPLRYPHRLKIDAAKAGGRAVTQARFLFPLLKDLPIEDLAIAATSKAEDVSLPNLVMDQGLSEASLDLSLDGGGMKIVGDGKLGAAKTSFQWEESFLDAVSPGTKISFKGTMNEEARRGFRVAWPEVIGANVGVNGTYLKNRGQPAKLDVDLDLTPASLTLPWFAWHKPTGEKAQGKVSVLIDKNQVDGVPSFAMKGAGASLRGSVDFADGSRWQTVHLDALTVPGSELRGTVDNRGSDNGLALAFTGAAADIRSMFEENELEDAAPSDKTAAPAVSAPPTSLVPLDIRFDIGRVVTGADWALSGAKGHIVRNTKGWTHLEIDGRVGDKATPIFVRLVPSPTGRSLVMKTDDAGAMFATLGLMKNIRGGVLEVTGQGVGSGAVEANAFLHDFRYLQPETLKKIAAAAQPKGAEALARDEGLAFSRLKAQFSYSGDKLEVKEARMAGDLMGLTLAGTVDLLAGQINLSGTIVPLYGINSLVGGIPVLGWILTGGEGGGIFAATYTVKGALRKPETSVNPLSILAPGFLRELFFVDRH